MVHAGGHCHFQLHLATPPPSDMSGTGAGADAPRVTVVNIDTPDQPRSLGASAAQANPAPSVADSAGTTRDSVASLKGLSKKLSDSLSFLKRG